MAKIEPYPQLLCWVVPYSLRGTPSPLPGARAQAHVLVRCRGCKLAAQSARTITSGDICAASGRVGFPWTMRMFHCKRAQGAGRNLQDLYEVIGQAERSTWWTYPQRFWREAHARFDARFRIIQCNDWDATLLRLGQWAQAPPPTVFEINIVQPGIPASQILPRSNVNIYLLVVQAILTNYNAAFGFYCSE
jgi:hypothetical protein